MGMIQLRSWSRRVINGFRLLKSVSVRVRWAASKVTVKYTQSTLNLLYLIHD